MTYVDLGGQRVPAVRYPRAFLQIGTANIPVLTATVTRKAVRHADSFSATLSVTSAAEFGFGYAEWADWDPDQDVAVIMSSLANMADQAVMITGKIDMPVLTMETQTVSISGRDKSASLTEKKRNTKFQNQSAADIVKTIANDHGLNPVVVATGSLAGKYYTQDLASLALNRSDYEVLSQLAVREGYRWYVEGDDLVFEPKETGSAGVYQLRYVPPNAESFATGNVLTLKLGKDSTASRPQTVTAAGWHHGKKQLFKAAVAVPGKGTPVEHRLHHNGHDQSQLETKAKAFANDMVRHELNLTATAPGDPSLDPHMGLSLTGTGTIYDTAYQIDEVEFSIGYDDGFDMTIQAKGSKPGRAQ